MAAADAAAGRVADVLWLGVAPRYAVGSGGVGSLGLAYLSYVVRTPGVFLRYAP